MNQEQLNKFVIYSLLTVILMLLLISFFGIKDANSCLNNPLVYGADKASTPETGVMFCSCSFSNPRYAPLYFNNINITTERDNLFSDVLKNVPGGLSYEE